MRKWAMRIVAVGGALLAMAVGTAAWLHRSQGRAWSFVTPIVWLNVIIYPRYLEMDGWNRPDTNPEDALDMRQYGVTSAACDTADTEASFNSDLHNADYGKYRHGFGLVRGCRRGAPAASMPSYTKVLCPTWAVIAALLLPTGLWSGMTWRHRRRVKAGHCANCGYDLRATPERCTECGRSYLGRG